MAHLIIVREVIRIPGSVEGSVYAVLIDACDDPACGTVFKRAFLTSASSSVGFNLRFQVPIRVGQLATE